MKKNKMMRIASALLIAVLLTTCAISGTFAKYVTSKDGHDEARVAKWGVTVDVAAENAFNNGYNAEDDSYNVNAWTVYTSNGKDVLAPGTNGTLATATVAGRPEVATRIKLVVAFDITNWVIDTNTFYCPVVVTVGDTEIKATSEEQFEADVIEAVKNAIYVNSNTVVELTETTVDGHDAYVFEMDYQPNELLQNGLNVTWNWDFDDNGAGTNDVNDTKLGDKAAAGNAAEMYFSIAITVTQID